MLRGTFSIVSRGDEISTHINNDLEKFLLDKGLKNDEIKPDYVFVIGGDGTVLSAFGKYVDIINDVKFLSIHTGHLGFYTDYQVKDYENIFEDMLTKEPKLESYPLLEVEAYCLNGNVLSKSYALNEITLNNAEGKTYKSEVYIDGRHFENFRGDGICISTPTGSTAYNKSLGGAVIHPGIEVYQVAEIAGLNNLLYRSLGNSMILSKEEKLTIRPMDQGNNHRLSIDQLYYSYDSLSKIEVSISKERRVNFIRYNEVSFWDRVKRSFIGE
ncbi:MAG: NAD kinase [Gemella sp.]|nr:NAD kinase [Gemella sp.]